MKTLKFCLMVAVTSLAALSIAWAGPINDPALLFIGTGGCGNDCPKLFGSQVNEIESNTLDILYQSKSNGTGLNTQQDPILLILAVPNDSTPFTDAPALLGVSVGGVSVGTPGQLGGTNTYGGTWIPGTGYAGQYISNQGGISVYDRIGLTPAGVNSANFSNMQAAHQALIGDVVSQFGLYVYTLTGLNLDPGDTAIVTFASNLQLGTFAFAYGCDAVVNGKCDGGGNTFSTPFTQSGFYVPEPATLLLLGSGLVGIGIFGRRFRKRD